MKKLIIAIIAFLSLFAISAKAVTLLSVPQGGTSAGTFTTGHLLTGNGTGAITTTNPANWNTAYGWGDHSTQNYFDIDTQTLDNVPDGTTYKLLTATKDGYIIDWTADQGATNIHAGNYTDTNTTYTAGTGLTLTTGAFSVNTSQNIATLSNLTTNGFITTSGGVGTLGIDTNTYLTGNETITLSGDISGSGATAITTTIGADKIHDSMIDWGTGANQVSSADMPDHNSHTVRDTFVHIVNRGVSSTVTVTETGGLGISWTSGEIYDIANHTFVATDAGSGNVTNTEVNYLKWVSGTTLTISTSDATGDEVLIATGSVYDGVINGYRHTSLLDESTANARRGLRALFPTRIISGMSVHEDTDVTNPLDVTMDAGVLWKEAMEKKTPVEIKSRTTAMVRHFHTAGAWDSDTNAQIETTNYDNGTDKTAIPSNKWVKGLFIFMNGKIGFVYPTEYFTNKAQAEEASLPDMPTGLEPIPKLTAIVYQQGTSDFTTAVWQDVRAGIGEQAFGGVSDHGALAGLSDDDHPQYLLADGSRNLGGAWNLGGQNLTNGGTITASFTGALTGNADTSTALAANGANCTAGHYPLGVDASGAVESCTADANTTYVSSDFIHDDLTGFVANEHLDWTADLGATNIHAGNYTDTNTTYLGGTNLTLADTTFNVDDAFVVNSGSDIVGGGAGFTWTFNASAGTDPVLTFGDGTANLSTGALQVGGVAVLTGNETITLSGDISGSGATAITTTIGADKILESHLKSVNAATDEYCLTYEATTGDFEWQTCGGSLAINDITDITIDTPADNEVLAYNTGTSTWLNQTPAEAGLQSVLTNSAGLLAALNDETGTGVSVFSTSPTLVTPLLGTPTSGVLTNCTGTASGLTAGNVTTNANLTGDITSVGNATTITADVITHADIADSDQADTKCLYLEDPVADDDLKSIWRNSTANNFLITEIWAESDQTVNFDLQIDDGTPADVNGTDISPAAGEAEDTSLSGDTTLAASEELDLIITSVSGTPTWVSICWTGNWVD